MTCQEPEPCLAWAARAFAATLLGCLCACSWNWQDGRPNGNLDGSLDGQGAVDGQTGERIAFQVGLAPVAGYMGGADTYVDADGPDTPHASSDLLQAADDRTALMFWDISQISSDREVLAVSITFFATDNGDSMDLVEAKRPWKAPEATWNEYALGQAWERPGGFGPGDSGADVLARVDPPSVDDFYTVALSAAGIALVQSWVRNPSENRGLMLIAPNRGTANLDGIRIASNEASVFEQRPKLSITLR